MAPDIANAAMQFLVRVQLRGDEVPAFNAVMQALHQEAQTAAKSGGGETGGHPHGSLPQTQE